MLAAFATDAGAIAAAQGRLEAEYTVTLSGLPIGKGDWVIDVSNDQFSAVANGGTTGLLRLFAGGHGSSSSRGIVSAAGQLIPADYISTIFGDKRIDDVRVAFAGGNVKDVSIDPPMGPSPDRIPVTDADRHNVLDPMTAVIDPVGGNGDPVKPEACVRHIAVFDGRLRFDLRSEYKRMDTVKAKKGYQGPAVVCAVYFVPVSGHVPNRPAIKYLAALRDAEVWMAPILGTRFLAPFRFSLPTPIGQGVLEATQFVTVAQPPRAAANVKTQ
jgi:hypothetical protein